MKNMDGQAIAFKVAFDGREFNAVEHYTFSVDSGLVMVGDPCHTNAMGNSDEEWDDFVRKFYTGNGIHNSINDGFVVSTVEGDGCFNIYGLYDTVTDWRPANPRFLLVELEYPNNENG